MNYEMSLSACLQEAFLVIWVDIHINVFSKAFLLTLCFGTVN